MEILYDHYCWTLDMIKEFKERLENAEKNLHKADLRGKITGLQLSLSWMENNQSFVKWLKENTNKLN